MFDGSLSQLVVLIVYHILGYDKWREQRVNNDAKSVCS